MYTLELYYRGDDESAVLVESADVDGLLAIAKDADFGAWAGKTGYRFVEVWGADNKLFLFNRV